jgi:methyl-accepting chemotaxis protein-1 (serine sensor receptor)
VKLMRRLPMAHKFFIVCLCFAIPLVYLLASLAGDRADARAFSAKELVGVAQVRQISGLLNAAMVLRGTSIGLSAKTPGAEENGTEPSPSSRPRPRRSSARSPQPKIR